MKNHCNRSDIGGIERSFKRARCRQTCEEAKFVAAEDRRS
jgi:hypothetical protein